MTIAQKDSEKMRRLADEGKQIAKISREDFPEYSYGEIYNEVYGSGGRAAIGVKRMINKKLKELVNAKPSNKQNIMDELNDHIWFLYNNYKDNQRKLDNIRNILGE